MTAIASTALSATVQHLIIDERHEGQRLDNFLLGQFNPHGRGVPKSHIYRIIRSGEVRINGKRCTNQSRLQLGDEVRIPPIHLQQTTNTTEITPANTASQPNQRHRKNQLQPLTLHEDERLWIINKPSGWAVHGGSGVSLGVIEQARLERPQQKFLELAHRLDRDTSGLLILAKKRQALVDLQTTWAEHRKYYWCWVKGHWSETGVVTIKQSLQRVTAANGERKVRANDSEYSKASISHMVCIAHSPSASLLAVHLSTGRMHQIRVHLSERGFPLAGDDKYGDFEWNKTLAKQGVRRLLLHAGQFVGATGNWHCPPGDDFLAASQLWLPQVVAATALTQSDYFSPPEQLFRNRKT